MKTHSQWGHSERGAGKQGSKQTHGQYWLAQGRVLIWRDFFFPVENVCVGVFSAGD